MLHPLNDSEWWPSLALFCFVFLIKSGKNEASLSLVTISSIKESHYIRETIYIKNCCCCCCCCYSLSFQWLYSWFPLFQMEELIPEMTKCLAEVLSLTAKESMPSFQSPEPTTLLLIRSWYVLLPNM